MASIMKRLRQPLAAFEQSTLYDAERIDYLIDETGLPKSDVIEFRMKNGSKWTIRPSGTEPKLKVYIFANARTREAAEQELDYLDRIVSNFCK